jgi:hypothetical protein
VYPEPDKVPRSCQIGTLAARFAPTLEELVIEWGSLPFPLGLVFEETLPHLFDLRVIEEGPDPLRRVEVYFHAEMPKLKNVQVGDMVSVSQVSPNPKKPNSFIYMGTECRWFLETVAIGQGGLAQNQGIICLIKDNQWVVRDKWIQVVDK